MHNGFFENLKTKYNLYLNEQQHKAAMHLDGPALVLAVPGAGKTTVLICRTAYLINHHKVPPYNILSLTFSRASAKDMEKRFNSIFGDDIGNTVHFSTIHSFAYMIIREYAAQNQMQYTLIEDSKSKYNKSFLLKQIYQEINKSNLADDKLEEIINTIGYVNNMMIPSNTFKDHNDFNIGGFSKIYKEYEKFKVSRNLIDFDDMLTLCLKILETSPNILEKYRRRYRFIQIDEGQDTSKIQNKIIEVLSSPKNNIFIVADDDQSIYGFRGAFPEGLLRFKDKYNNAKIYFMEENFRSTNNIVSVCKDFITTNKSRYEKNIFTNNKLKRPVTIIKTKDEFEQLSYIEKGLNSIDNDTSTAILYRNNVSSIPLIDLLSRKNIPFRIRDSKSDFFKHWVVKDIVSFLKFSLDTKDYKSFETIYYKMKGYISKAAVQYIITKDSHKSVFDNLLKYPEYKHFQLKNIRELKGDFKTLAIKRPYDAISYIQYHLDYERYLTEYCKMFGFSYNNIKTIISNLKMIAKNTKTLDEFIYRLRELHVVLRHGTSGDNDNSLLLSTVHSSKGLEFDRVFIVDLIDGEFPSSHTIELSEEDESISLEEERRLLYVGMTRAREYLDLITYNLKDGEKVYQSRFLMELESIIKPTLQSGGVEAKRFRKKAIVHHKKFGIGKVLSIEDNLISIDFNSCGVKHLSLNFCLENDILSIVE